MKILLGISWIFVYLVLASYLPTQAEKKNATSNSTNTETIRNERRTITYVTPRKVQDPRNKQRFFNPRATATRNDRDRDSNLNTVGIIAPNEYAYTISSHPTFTLYLPIKGRNINLLLEEKGTDSNQLIWEENIQVAKAGINTVTLPRDKKGLQVGKDYRFVVSEIVNPQDRSEDIVAQVWLSRLELSTATKAKLANINDAGERAIILAEQGIWYDSVALLINSTKDSDLFASLLNQVNFKNIERQSIIN